MLINAINYIIVKLIVGVNNINIEYNASNPDFIDNSELVIQNALHKYGLAPKTDNIMYNTSNGYVSLLNNVFVFYNFTLNDRNYYFDSFANAKK